MQFVFNVLNCVEPCANNQISEWCFIGIISLHDVAGYPPCVWKKKKSYIKKTLKVPLNRGISNLPRPSHVMMAADALAPNRCQGNRCQAISKQHIHFTWKMVSHWWQQNISILHNNPYTKYAPEGLTHWGRGTHICIGNLFHHWFR